MRWPSASRTRSRCMTAAPVGDVEGSARSAVASTSSQVIEETARLAAHPQGALGVGPQRKRLNEFGFRHHGAAAAPFDAALDQQLVQRLADGLPRDAEAGGQFAFGWERHRPRRARRGSSSRAVRMAYGLLIATTVWRTTRSATASTSSMVASASALGILGRVVVAAQPQRVGPPGVRDEVGVDAGAALGMKRGHRRRGERGAVAGFGRHQVPLGGDVLAGQPAHPLAEPRRQPVSGRLVVALRRRRVEQRAVREVVQRGGEHQFVVGAVVDGAGRRLQCVVEFVDRLLVPHATQRRQQAGGVGERVHGCSIPSIGLYQLFICRSGPHHRSFRRPYPRV